jgi:heptosyltransferase-2
MRIAIIKSAALGDVLRTTALLPALRRRHNSPNVTWIASDDSLPIVSRNTFIDCAVSLSNAADASWRSESYDWVISLDEEPTSCKVATSLATRRLSGAYVDDTCAVAYTDDMSLWFGMGLLRSAKAGGIARANQLKVQNRLSYCHILYECLDLSPPIAGPQLFVTPDEEAQARLWREESGIRPDTQIVALNTGAGDRWQHKRWGESQTAALASQLCEQLNVTVVILGGPEETERNERIRRTLRHPGIVVAPTNMSVYAFAALLRLCRVLVTSDSLALHIAAASGITTIAFFGPTSDAEADISGLGEKIVAPIACRCCYLSRCDRTPHCMDALTVDMLFHAVKKRLA